MILNISKETYKSKWVDFEDCELKLRPYPTGRNDIVFSSGRELTVTGKQRKKIYMYSLMGWKGLNDGSGKEIPYTNDVKELIFDHNLGGIAGFVYGYNTNFETRVKGELENLQVGAGGDSTAEATPAPNADKPLKTDL